MSTSKHESKAFDPAVRAEVDLDRILDADSPVTRAREANNVPIATELKKERLVVSPSTRIKSRVLFVTSNLAVLKPGDPECQFYINLESVFDEVHIILLCRKGCDVEKAVRVSTKVWVYTVATYFFVQLPFAARSRAVDELMFTDGFRPDIIVARDPFESALAAYLISERFDRPLQIHVLDDVAFNEKQFIEAAKENGWRLRFMHFVLRRAESVRTSTDAIKSMLQKRYKHIEDIALIPRFFNTRALLALPRSTTEDMFPQFSFTVLYIGDLSPESTLFRALDTVRVLLSTPTIGFVVIGEGSQKQHYKERAALLGIEKQVLFLGAVSDTTAHIRSADVLLVTDTTTESEDLIIRAAALGTPLIMAETPIRKDLFTDGESAFLCPPEEGMAFAEKMRLFINANALRTQFSQNGRSVVQNRIEDSPERFTVAFRDTIEQVLFNVEVSGTISPQSEPTLGTVSAASPAPTTVIDGVEMKLPEEAKE